LAALIVAVATTKVWVLLVTEPAPHCPVPPVDATVTVKFVEPVGVEPVVEIVSVVVVLLFDTVVGLNAAVSPVAGVQLIVSGAEVQVPGPVQVVVIA
jgi:hypothetical protein